VAALGGRAGGGPRRSGRWCVGDRGGGRCPRRQIWAREERERERASVMCGHVGPDASAWLGVKSLTSVGPPQGERECESYHNFRRPDLADGSCVIFTGFSSSRRKLTIFL
jgi:hypothetical protein